VIKGDDGVDYLYGLKGTGPLQRLFVRFKAKMALGHEDLRQDERVMQLFGLINDLLSVDTESFKRRLHIQRYAIIPLAPNAGLMGWVENSDTLHALIRDYRHPRKVLINLEYRLMTQVCALLGQSVLTPLTPAFCYYSLPPTTSFFSLFKKSKHLNME